MSRSEAAAIASRAQDPVWFCRNILGHDPWLLPRQIMRSLMTPRARVAVKSCHSSGKTFTAAEVALWAVYVLRAIVITTAPTWNQVEKLLWREIHVAHRGSRYPLGGDLLTTELKVSTNVFAVGLSTNEGVRFQGWHAAPGHPLVLILDEGPGVAADIYEAIEGIRAGGDVRIMAVGNPVIPSGPFYAAFTSERDSWVTYTIDALATPNFTDDLSRPMTVDELRALSASELAHAPRPYLTTRIWALEKLRDWGEESPLWASRVRGAFPQQSEDSLLSLAWLERAGVEPDPVLVAMEPLYGGIDVAGPGEDETVLTLRTESGQVAGMWFWSGPDPRGDVVAELARVRGRLRRVSVDVIGVGYNFALHLEDQGFPVQHVNVAERPVADGDERFANLKAQLYWGLRERLAAGGIGGLVDDVAVGQLAGIRYQQDSRGRVVIESKEKARKRGVKSPDRAESLMLAFAPELDDEGGTVTSTSYLGSLFR